MLAYDRMVLEVRAEVRVPSEEAQDRAEFTAELASDLAFALSTDPALGTRTEIVRRLEGRIRRALAGSPRKIDFLVDSGIESAAVLDLLRAIDARRSFLFLHYNRNHVRVYPERAATAGIVGFVGEKLIDDGTSVPVYRGMEALLGLRPGSKGNWTVWQDARANRYWTDDLERPARPAVLECTLDLELQKAAHEELQRAVDAVTDKYESPPEWGAMCLAEVETGEVLALASFRDGERPETAAFSPLQNLYEPGSVVKPLVFSIALRRGLLNWHQETFDCRPSGAGGWYVPNSRRLIRDEHDCGDLDPRAILVESSNIGAVQVGLRLGREGFAEYLDTYRFAQKTQLGIPGESQGWISADRVGGVMGMPQRTFWVYTAPSLSFGYETNVTPVQLLRAYLTLLSGRPRELQLYRRTAVSGRVHDVPKPPEGERFLTDAQLGLLVDAMRGVVSDEPNATGRWLFEELQEKGMPVVAGKTGTSQNLAGQTWIRTASFAGFAPVDKPRYLAVCVLQKPGAAAFWGGRYAAPAAGRLLLRALTQSLPERPLDAQVSARRTEGRTARLDER